MCTTYKESVYICNRKPVQKYKQIWNNNPNELNFQNGRQPISGNKDMTLNYTTREINANYRIKVFGMNENGKKINTLVGVSGLLNLIGIELTNKLLARREKCMDDACVCKLRRGLKVTFYVK